MLDIWSPMFGFFIGSLIFSRILQWVLAIFIAVKEYRDGYGSPWAIPSYLLLHSAPWLMAAMVFLAIEEFSAPHEPWWPWFFSGAGIAFACQSVTVLRYTMKRRVRPGTSIKPKPLRGSA